MIKRFLTILFLLVATAFSLQLFDAAFVPSRVLNYVNYLLIIGSLIFALPTLIKARGGFTGPVRIIVISILFSMPMAYLLWGQDASITFFETLTYLSWIYFFVLIRLNLPIATLEKIVVGFGLAYLVLFFFQYLTAPTIYFGHSLWGDTFSMDRGVIRIIFPGAGIFILTALMALNKITSRAPGRLLWMVLAAMGLVIPVMQVTRQFIAGMGLLFVFHILRTQNLLLRMLTLGATAMLVIGLLNANITQIDGSIAAAQRDFNLGGDYIRVKAGAYFLTEFSPEWPGRIFGNGAARWGEGEYGRFVEMLGDHTGYFLSDVGIIAVYANFGVFAIFGFALIWYRSVAVPLPEEYQYLKYYLWYLLFTSVTWYSVYHHHYVIATAFALYIYHRIQTNTVLISDAEGVDRPHHAPPNNEA